MSNDYDDAFEADERDEIVEAVTQTADALAEAVAQLREIASDSDVDTGEMSYTARDVLVNLLQVLSDKYDVASLVEDAMSQ